MRNLSPCLTSCLALAMTVATGCGDPVPPLPRGGFQATLVKGDHEKCPLQPHNGQVGLVDASSKKSLATDGVDGATIQCEVVGEGTYSVTGYAQHADSALSITIPEIGPGASESNPAKGGLSFASQGTSIEPYQSSRDGCSFYFQKGTPQAISPGQIWVAFKCPEVVNDGVNKCAISQGYAYFEACTTGEE